MLICSSVVNKSFIALVSLLFRHTSYTCFEIYVYVIIREFLHLYLAKLHEFLKLQLLKINFNSCNFKN